MNQPPTEPSRRDQVWDDVVQQGLQELDLAAPPAPDCTAAVLAAAARESGKPNSTQRGARLVIPGAVLAASLGAVVWIMQSSWRPAAITEGLGPATGDSTDSPGPNLPPTPHHQDTSPLKHRVVRSAAQIADLPDDTESVQCLGIPAAAIRGLRRLPRLRQVQISNSIFRGVDPAILKELSRLGHVESVLLEAEVVGSDPATFRLLTRMPALRSVKIVGYPLTGAMLQQLARIKRLDRLHLVGRLGITPAEWIAFGKSCPTLRHLTLDETVHLGHASRLTAKDEARRNGMLIRIDRAAKHRVTDEIVLALPLRTLISLELRQASVVRGHFFEDLAKSSTLLHLSLGGCTGIAPDRFLHLPTSLRTLDVHDTKIETEALQRLRSLRRLNVWKCWNVTAKLVDIAARWPGCVITSPSSTKISVSRAGMCSTATKDVRLVAVPRDDSYGKAAYSFRFQTRNSSIHRNHVDLVLNACRLIHIRPTGSEHNRIVDLGANPRLPAALKPPETGWREHSFLPRAGHSYLLEKRASKGTAASRILLRVASVDANSVTIQWRHPNPKDCWRDLPTPGLGRKGIMGNCGGPHAPR